MRRKRRGFSLLEALITLTLMSVLLGVVASLMRDASLLTRQANADPLVALQAALEPVCADVHCAYQVNQCDSSAVEIVRLDPSITSRLPSTPPTAFTLHGSDASLKVRYFAYADSLWSETTYPDTSSETNEVAPGISALDGQLVKPGLVQLSISTQDNTSNPVKVVSMYTLVEVHRPPQVMP